MNISFVQFLVWEAMAEVLWNFCACSVLQMGHFNESNLYYGKQCLDTLFGVFIPEIPETLL